MFQRIRLDDTILSTFAELDPFEREAATEYCGIWSTGDGEPPVWPRGSGKRVFC